MSKHTLDFNKMKHHRLAIFTIFTYFLLLILTFVLSNHTFLGVQDEAHLQATLMGNEPINYMTSYPLAKLFGYLYVHFPAIQWYSVMMVCYIIFIALIMSLYIIFINTKHTYLTLFYKSTLFIIFNLLIVYMLLEVDVTSPTLIIIVLATPLIKKHQVYFWFLLWIASFLREQILVSILPLIILAYAIHVSKTYFTKKNTLAILVLLLGILFNHFSYTLDKTYNEWMDFTEKRAYYTDFGGQRTKGQLTADEYHLAKTWWITDLDLYPSTKISNAAGSTIDILEERFTQKNVAQYMKNIFQRHSYIYVLLLLSLIITLLYKSPLRFLSYGAFFIGFALLMVVKDVERVTLPLMLLWWSILTSDFWYYKTKRYDRLNKGIIGFIFLWLIYYIAETLPIDRITQYEQKEALVQECKSLLQKHPMALEITSGYPASWERLVEVLMQNHLFDEKNWVDYHDDLLLSGWLSRVPLVYAQHHISFGGITRQYPHYHDWMLDSHSGIIGSKGESKHIRPFLRDKLMKLYDQKFPKKGCFHTPIVIDQTKHFIIHHIIQKCTHIEPIHTNIQFLEKNKVWDIYQYMASTHHTMSLQGHTLTSSSKDPWILVGIEKKLRGDILFHIEITSSINTTLQLFYRSTPSAPFSQMNTYTITLHTGYTNIILKLPAKYLNHTLRLDPVTHKGNYTIGDIAIYTLDNNITQK